MSCLKMETDSDSQNQLDDEPKLETVYIVNQSSNFLNNTTDTLVKAEWSTYESNLLLKMYNKYISHVGTGERFRTKKIMFDAIAKEISPKLSAPKSGTHCENRYKSLIRQVRNDTKKQIEGKPQVYISKNDATIKADTTSTSSPLSTTNMSNSISNITEVLYKIHKEKEKSKQRRHLDKMQLLEKLIDVCSECPNCKTTSAIQEITSLDEEEEYLE